MVSAKQATPISLRKIIQEKSQGLADSESIHRDCLERLRRWEPQLQAWTTPPAPTPAADSKDATAGPLSGIPVGVKDLIDVAGLPTRCGSSLRDGTAAAADAACVAALRKLGATVLGKTVTTEFGYFAPGPTTNPWHPGHTPGGSSSGSAATVGAGVVPLALGTQTAGSLTRPASYCGTAGFVTARGSADLAGITGLSPTLDTLGLLAAGVDDVYLAWTLLSAGEIPAPLDAHTAPEGLVIHYWDGSPVAGISPETRALTDAAAAALQERGARVVPLGRTELIDRLIGDHLVVMSYEATRERAAEKKRLDQLSPPLQELLLAGEQISEARYGHALERIHSAEQELGEDMGPAHVIMGPAAPSTAPAGLSATGSPVLSRPWQALGRPVVTVPGLRAADGMPLGLQVIGRPGDETHLFHAAAWIENVVNDETAMVRRGPARLSSLTASSSEGH